MSATQQNPDLSLASQAVGYWTGVAHRAVVGRTSQELAEVGLTQPSWWTLSQLATAPDGLTRQELAAALQARLDATGRDHTHRDAAVDDLLTRGWVHTDTAGRLRLTDAGENTRADAVGRVKQLRELMHDGVSEEEYAVAVQVLRRVVTNLGGAAELP